MAMTFTSAQTPPATSRRPTMRAWAALLRPRQWVKNLFVLPAPLFGLAHETVAARQVLCVAGAFVAFCALSSTVYALNDVIDAEADRLHPLKRARPVASGAISPRAALLGGGCLLALSAAFASALGLGFVTILLAYLANSLAYIFFLKERVIADVLSIAIGFMLRILAGAVAVSVEPSGWLMICGFAVAVLLGFCKRRSEIEHYADASQATQARDVFRAYTKEKLDVLLGSMAAIAIVTYMLWTVSPETVARHHTTRLIFTSPFVVYCVLRFVLKSMEARGEDAAEMLLRDRGFIAAGLGWFTSVAAILYGPLS